MTSAASLSVFSPIQPAPTWFFNNTHQSCGFSTESYTDSYKIQEISSCHSSSSFALYQLLWIPLLSSSPKDTSILFSFAPRRTAYSHLKWGSETEEHTRNGWKLTLTTNCQSSIVLLKFCFTEILFYFYLLTDLFNSVVCCWFTSKTNTKTLFCLYRCILYDC